MEDWHEIADTLKDADKKEFMEEMKYLEDAQSLSALMTDLKKNEKRRRKKAFIYGLMLIITPFGLVVSKEVLGAGQSSLLLFVAISVVLFSLWKVRDYTYRDSKKSLLEDIDIYVRHKQYKMAIDRMRREITLSPSLEKAFSDKLAEVQALYKRHLEEMQ
jgi:hypothetical protein